ncbi:helix-turn-helix domain-containing protein [Liquorilactobacillus sicerae]|uniref:helix-turn-helix domain-containing protein n=1 Tax=Liquorilactobacillus sicerae TaxID=1416943 RepID=UPI002480DC5C|nr:helix-turn-helix transcriptional regulator [Liquorilactobacillus sicerae]
MIKLNQNITLLSQIISSDIFIYQQRIIQSTIKEESFNLQRIVEKSVKLNLKENILLVSTNDNFHVIEFRIDEFLILVVPHLNTTNIPLDFHGLLEFGVKISESCSLLYQLLCDLPAPKWKYEFQANNSQAKIEFVGKDKLEKLYSNEQNVFSAVARLDEEEFTHALHLPTYTGYLGSIFEEKGYERGMKDSLIHFISILFHEGMENNKLAVDLVLKLQDDLLGRIEFRTSLKPFIQTMQELATECFIALQKVKNMTNLSLAEQCALYIKNCVYRKVTLQNISAYLGYSPSTISHKFKREYNMSIKSYINLQKIEAAKHMLATNVLSPSEIANSLHFSSQSYFNYVFKDLVGVSPTEYRGQIR